jgi:hypothetical protein
VLVPAAILTRLGVPWPAPLAISSVIYLAVDRWSPDEARASWVRLGTLDRRHVIAIVGISIVASSSLVLWAHLTDTTLAGVRSQFPDAPALLLLVAAHPADGGASCSPAPGAQRSASFASRRVASLRSGSRTSSLI